MVEKKSRQPFDPIVLIGAGDLASHLGRALRSTGANIIQVFSRKKEKARDLGKALDAHPITSLTEVSKEGDLYILAVKDEAIDPVFGNLPLPENATAVHTSGSIPMSALERAPGRYGVFYPFQTFSKGKSVNWEDLPLCVEGSDRGTTDRLRRLGEQLSRNTHVISSDQRKTLHIAGIFACNFTNHLYTLSSDILEKEGMHFRILEPLVRETLEKALEKGPEEAQTGPAYRKERAVINGHLRLLEGKKELKELYETFSRSIISRYHGEEL